MTTTEAANVLKEFNEWRRGSEIEQPNPSTIGIAIDTILEVINKLPEVDKNKVRTYSSNEVLRILQVSTNTLAKFKLYHPEYVVSRGKWDADAIDKELVEREYRKSIKTKNPIYGKAY